MRSPAHNSRRNEQSEPISRATRADLERASNLRKEKRKNEKEKRRHYAHVVTTRGSTLKLHLGAFTVNVYNATSS